MNSLLLPEVQSQDDKRIRRFQMKRLYNPRIVPRQFTHIRASHPLMMTNTYPRVLVPAINNERGHTEPFVTFNYTQTYISV